MIYYNLEMHSRRVAAEYCEKFRWHVISTSRARSADMFLKMVLHVQSDQSEWRHLIARAALAGAGKKKKKKEKRKREANASAHVRLSRNAN